MKLQRHRRLSPAFFAGLVLLAAANITRVMLEHHTSMTESMRDGLFGVLMGLAIGSLLLGLWRTNHPAPDC